MSPPVLLQCDRALSPAEERLFSFALMQDGIGGALQAQLSTLRVKSQSSGPCPEVEFDLPESHAALPALTVVADYFFHVDGGIAGFCIYVRGQRLAAAGCWSMDGVTRPDRWPALNELRSVGFPALRDWLPSA